MVRLFPLMALCFLAACVPDEPTIGVCNPDPVPITRVTPTLPAQLHNTFEGYAVVELEVSERGEVQRPRILSEEWNPVGRARSEPEGYEEAILSAVSRWRFSSVERKCRMTTRFEFELEKPA